MKSNNIRSSSALLLWGVFFLYLVLAACGIARHEMWGDEIHAWNIAKASNSITELLRYTRYEGHPPLWHLLLWLITRISSDPVFMQVLHFGIAAVVCWILLFESPLPLFTKLLLPFGYFFLYEYAVLSRNYALAVMLVLLLLRVMLKKDNTSQWMYFLLLFLLSFTHIYGIFLALSLHGYWCLQKPQNKKLFWLSGFAGLLLLLPAAWFVFPPGEGETNLRFFLDRWQFNQVVISIQAPLRAWIPVVAWWDTHSWNTQFVLQWQQELRWLRFITPLISIGILVTAAWVLRRDKKSCGFFLFNALLNFGFSCIIFPMASLRYSGFIFIGWVAAWWLFCAERKPDKKENAVVNILLGIQVIAAMISFTKDLTRPFSRLPEISQLLRSAPAGVPVVTDYWTLNAVSAFTNSSMYCIDLHKPTSFVVWGKDFAMIRRQSNRYDAGLKAWFRQSDADEVCLISTGSPLQLLRADAQFVQTFHPTLIGELEGSIEKGSDLYLYSIKRR